MTNVRRQPPQSRIEVVLIGDTWMVRQDLTAEDAREVAWAFGPRDGVHQELLEAAEEADGRNAE